jgi:hypothetical protein
VADPRPPAGPNGGQGWRLTGFLDRLDEWAAQESPGDDLRLIVTSWIMSRFDDPYQGVRREGGMPNLWFGVVPWSGDGAGGVVVCAYWIEEATHTVRCDSFATLRLPG